MSNALKSKPTSFIAALIAVCFTLNLIGTLNALGQEPIDHVNPMIGTTGPSVYDYGGMIPGVATPFGMTHWTAMTRENKISVCPYNYKDKTIEGFLGTHQPAIWMGDYGYVTLVPEVGPVRTSPEQRQLPFARAHEVTTPYYYSVIQDAGSAGTLRTEITATGSSFSSVEGGSSAVAIHWNGVDGPILAQVTPDASGAISAKFKIPANLEPGYYIITATQTEKSGAPAWGTPAKIAFQVVGPGGAVANSQGEAQGVAQSPANSGFGAGAGTVGLLAGLGILGLRLFVLGTASFIGSYRKSPAVSAVRKR